MGLSKDRLEALIGQSTDLVIATDRKGTVIYYNDGASKSLAYSPKEVLGTFVGRLYPSVDEAKRVMAAMRSTGFGGLDTVATVKTVFLSKSGEKIPVAISGALLRDENGEEDGTIGFAKDLRDFLHQEEMATLGEVAIGLAHEIRNPLAVVVNQAELLENEIYTLAGERDCSVENERLDAIRREVARISEIVERLGEMARTDTYETIDYVGPKRMIDLRRQGVPGPDERLRGLRVLICDDDGGICQSLREILEADGCQVATAGDGVEALAAIEAEETPFDVVLSDVVMPRMDGYELFQALQAGHPDLPVLMMTAFHYDKDHIIKRSRVEGLEGVVFKKPVDPARLRAAIVEAVSSRRD